MKIISDTNLRNFDFWSGAASNAKELSYEQLDELEYILEEQYPEGITATELNDIMWFDFDAVKEWLGISDEYDESFSRRHSARKSKRTESVRRNRNRRRVESTRRTSKHNRINEDLYRGVKGVEFVWRGTQSDPLLKYKGKTFNYYDIEDALWDEFKEMTGSNSEDAFDRWIQRNPEEVTNYLDDAIYGGYGV